MGAIEEVTNLPGEDAGVLSKEVAARIVAGASETAEAAAKRQALLRSPATAQQRAEASADQTEAAAAQRAEFREMMNLPLPWSPQVLEGAKAFLEKLTQ